MTHSAGFHYKENKARPPREQGRSACVKKRVYVTAIRLSGSRVSSIQSCCGNDFRDIFIWIRQCTRAQERFAQIHWYQCDITI